MLRRLRGKGDGCRAEAWRYRPPWERQSPDWRLARSHSSQDAIQENGGPRQQKTGGVILFSLTLGRSAGFARRISLWPLLCFAAVLATVALFLTATGAQAQQTQRAPAKQEVLDNLAPHPAPEQPIPYSHKTHVGTLGLQCQMCHTNPDPGNQMTFPATSTCMTCHNSVAKDKPAIVKLADFAKSGQPIPWVRVYQVTPGVTWTHRKHLQAGMQCAMCHGNVGQLDAMAETTSVTSMASCISCHQAHNAPAACATCHAWPSAAASN